MRIKGILATQGHKLSPEQWVNIYQFTITGKAEFSDCFKVKYLVNLDDPSEYCLELIEEEKVMPGEA